MIEKEILAKRKQDAKELMNHYLLKEFFEEIDKYCYSKILSINPNETEELKHFALLAQCNSILKGKLRNCAELMVEHKKELKQARNIHE